VRRARAGLSRFARAAAGTLAGCVLILAAIAVSSAQESRSARIEDVRKLFVRPAGVPHPVDNPPTPEKIALGERLFNEPRFSGNGKVACATCHNPALAFGDGTALSRAGATGVTIRRHTPALWNLAWAPRLFWDGRAKSLEHQARFPMSHPDEMASSPEQAARWLAADPSYRGAFEAAFPGEVTLTGEHVLKAIAAYVRTLVSPPTRFDRWIAGDEEALTAGERRGFAIFSGKGRCINCHTEFAFTDHAFHDIGLPSGDVGRGPIAALPAANHAFKTPGLRELAWTAPYMHDGSLATLEDVIRHYESGGIVRPTRSQDMPGPIALTDTERADLVAFLETLSSEEPPKATTEAWARRGAPVVDARPVDGNLVRQRDRMFAPAAIKIHLEQRLTILNDDTRTHNVRISSRLFNFNSGAQDPGESVALQFDHRGLFEAHCGIHPTMRLRIEVE
jgi:cytochrome c peroxidase